MAVTPRLTGRYAKLTLGSTAGASDLYNSADLFNVELDIETDREPMTAMNDDWHVRKINLGSWSARAEKWFATIDFLDQLATVITSKATVFLTFYRGGSTAVGAEVFRGECNIVNAGVRNPLGGVQERIELESTGAPTVATS